MAVNNLKKQPFHFILLLILGGEAVFILPFVLARVFRPTVLDVFNLTNVALGSCFSMYGIIAMISYLFVVPLADSFQPRKLMGLALVLTAAGGLVYANEPSLTTLHLLYGYWGFTTIFLFWAPMIKATRVWGGGKSQGKAFGFLDGGRGMVGVLFASLGVLIFSMFIIGEVSDALLEDRQAAFRYVVLVSSGIVALIGVLVWFFLKMPSDGETAVLESINFRQIRTVLKIPAVWLLMIIILCAYVGYKITDIFSLYANEVMLYDEVKSAQVGTFLLFIRPIVGVLIGFIADKSRTTLWLIISFIIAIVGATFFALGIIDPSSGSLFIMSILITATGVYAIRSLYFATMQEGKIPLVLTGTAVGMISLIGYTPDIFASPAMGYLLDSSPGETGHQHVFLMLIAFSIVGLIASIIFYKISKR
jgi:sugar phosphate permease